MNILKIVTICAFFFASSCYANDLVVVVNKASAIDELEKNQVIDIYMGRRVALPDGSIAKPIDLNDKTNIKESFYLQLVNKDLRKINAYWARLLFSARAKPPLKADSINDAIINVSNSLDKVAYIPESELTDSLKVVYRIGTLTSEAQTQVY